MIAATGDMNGARRGLWRPWWVLALTLLLGGKAGAEDLAGPQAAALAQAAADSGGDHAAPSLLRDVRSDFGNVFTKSNLLIIGAGLGAAAAAYQVDDEIATGSFNSELDEGTALDDFFEAGETAGSAVVQVGGAFATYGLGMLLSKPGMRDLGRDLVRAQIVTQTFTVGLKYAVGRDRPDHSNQLSFPSGHASAAFATATVLHRRYGARAGIPAYALAAYIAGSRMNEGVHFLSDVVFGATLGIVGGRSVGMNVGKARVSFDPVLSPCGVGVCITAGLAGMDAAASRPWNEIHDWGQQTRNARVGDAP